MKSVHLALCTLLLTPTLTAYASRQILPAGSLINCTVSESKLSSKTTAVGDPVLCKASITTRNGSTRLPFNTYLEGRFEDYKDPGHFVGKGWMELKFDRMVIEPRTVIPLEARVVDVPGFAVDQKGRIMGKGHATRDVVLWSIPVLWPIDLLMLPGRGPRPTLKTETRLTLKVMDDMEVPVVDDPERDPSGLYRREPSAFNDPPQNEPQQQMAQAAPAPQPPAYQPPPPAYQPSPQQYQQQDQSQYQPQQYQQPQYQPQQYQPQQSYAVPAPVAAYVMPMYAAPAPVVYVYAAPPPPPVRVYMYSPPSVAMWSAPRTVVYQSAGTYRSLYGY